MGNNSIKIKAFVEDFQGTDFPESLKNDLIGVLDRHLRMLKLGELIDEEFSALVRRTIQPVELFEEIQRNKIQRRKLRTELDRIRQLIGLE